MIDPRLRAIRGTPGYEALMAALDESVENMYERALNEQDDKKAYQYFIEARAARRLAFNFRSKVEAETPGE